jgi:hypothetical protein
MPLLAKSKSRLPRTFYEKGKELVEQARKEPDPDIRKFLLRTAKEYYGTDMTSKEPFLQTLVAVVVVYVLVIGLMIYTFKNFSLYVALPLVVASFAVCAFLIGAAFRAAGYISESTFLGIFKAGLRALLFRWKQ